MATPRLRAAANGDLVAPPAATQTALDEITQIGDGAFFVPDGPELALEEIPPTRIAMSFEGTSMRRYRAEEPISFRSSVVEAADGGGRVQVRGGAHHSRAERAGGLQLSMRTDGHVTWTTQLVQSEWGIKPHRGLMGALKVRESVEVAFDGFLPSD
jgi:hypothetical protein